MIEELNRSSGAPLHQQLAQVLRSAIQDGEFAPGQQFPSENRLQSLFAVSRSVVRQALASLASVGLIERVKGSGATVVSTVKYHRLAQSQIGLAAQLSTLGTETSTTVHSIERLPKTEVEFGKGATRILFFERIQSIDEMPIALIQTWLPLPLFEGLTQTQLENSSLHKIMDVTYGIILAGGSRQVRAISSDDALSKKLKVREGSPLLLLAGVNTDAGGMVVEKFSTWHRSDLVALDFTIS